MGARKQGKRILEPNVGTNKTKNRGAGGENDSKWWDRIGYGVYTYKLQTAKINAVDAKNMNFASNGGS